MTGETEVQKVAHVIQLSVAPVFLMAGISGLLNVLTNRLGRIIDRARLIESQAQQRGEAEIRKAQDRLLVFSQRARLINVAITLCTACASMVCLVIMALFAATFFEVDRVDLSKLVAVLFIAAMASLFLALMFFLREILLATRSLRIGGTTSG
jgi:hypothetical protein